MMLCAKVLLTVLLRNKRLEEKGGKVLRMCVTVGPMFIASVWDWTLITYVWLSVV